MMFNAQLILLLLDSISEQYVQNFHISREILNWVLGTTDKTNLIDSTQQSSATQQSLRDILSNT